MANATAKPSVVTTPTHLPPCSYASGIIVLGPFASRRRDVGRLAMRAEQEPDVLGPGWVVAEPLGHIDAEHREQRDQHAQARGSISLGRHDLSKKGWSGL
jgi:hypothetical protein